MSEPAAREETIFNVARQLSHPLDLEAYLDGACGEDKRLRDRVERLLEAERHANKFLAGDPLGLEKENTGNEADKSACAGPDPGTVSASMVSVAPAPGDVLEDYEIIERIGGNMGLVFKARHRLLDRIVALKLLPADAITDPARLARFRRELKIMGQLEHPNLVTAVDARIVDRWHMVAMEFIDGTDLERLVETRGALPITDACEAARQTALALQYAHQHGLIHRDIKPSNLMLTHAGTIKVIDMGLAVIQEESTGQLTRTGLVMGTMRYCAPEQFRDASRVDIRADIYSLGCTLFHLLTGKPPYSQRTTVAEVVQAHLNEPFPDLAEELPDAPAELNAILTRMTAKDPGARFAAPGEVVEALAPFTRRADLKQLLPATTSQPQERRTRQGKTHEPPRKPREGFPPLSDGTSTRPRLITAAFVALLALLGRPKRLAVTLFVLLLIITAAVLIVKSFGHHDPRVVLMDATVEKAIYDANNVRRGRFNADELIEVLKEDLPRTLVKEQVADYKWDRVEFIVEQNPELLVIHRSCFFHALAAEFKHPLYSNSLSLYPPDPPFDTPEGLKAWEAFYDSVEEKLITLMGTVRRRVPHAHFLVYSRGTDKRWLDKEYREGEWIKKVEARFSELEGRIRTMVIPDGDRSTFRHPETRANLRSNVLEILGLPDKRQQ